MSVILDKLKRNIDELVTARTLEWISQGYSEELSILDANIQDIQVKIEDKIKTIKEFIGEAELIVHCCDGDYGLYVADPYYTEELLKSLEGKRIRLKIDVLEK